MLQFTKSGRSVKGKARRSYTQVSHLPPSVPPSPWAFNHSKKKKIRNGSYLRRRCPHYLYECLYPAGHQISDPSKRRMPLETAPEMFVERERGQQPQQHWSSKTECLSLHTIPLSLSLFLPRSFALVLKAVITKDLSFQSTYREII